MITSSVRFDEFDRDPGGVVRALRSFVCDNYYLVEISSLSHRHRNGLRRRREGNREAGAVRVSVQRVRILGQTRTKRN